MRLRTILLLVLALLGGAALGLVLKGWRPTPKPHGRTPLLIIGIDGGEWKVIRRLWSEGELPNLKKIADRGATATLRTAYNSSPVIWTTIATGVTPPVHGITDFVVATPQGDVPISSAVRKVPALWNMLSRAGRRVAVLGWWGSWPAEEINGVVLSDRALLDLDARVSPVSYLPHFLAELRRAEADPGLFFNDDAQRRDRVMARCAARLVREGYDLVLLYFRSPDIVSHNEWKYFEPEKFAAVDPRELAKRRDRIPRIYEAVDREIGRILAAAPPETNVLVLSDHGFHAAPHEDVKALIDMDAVLERLGYLARRDGVVDFSRTRVYTYGTPDFRRGKMLRFAAAGREPGGSVRPEEREALRRRLEADLAKVTNDYGEPIFLVREVRPRRGEEGDFVAAVRLGRMTPTVRIEGRPFPEAIRGLGRISGTHGPSTDGVFLASGPDIDPAAHLEGIHVHDIAPTILYGLGLPVAEDFAGKPRMDLFNAEFRRTHPLRTIRTWGKRQEGGAARTSRADAELLNELRALGYIR
ncbi:MAG TPA: alkaline phosphatase family protein [Thermoanaerobaculia bacterium]|jgi:predicted AlkP superfamily phosphohydrolase/phosphomutase|nr:alkaline phosphatase family protein [Thermoanaerobaculia bacterium]